MQNVVLKHITRDIRAHYSAQWASAILKQNGYVIRHHASLIMLYMGFMFMTSVSSRGLILFPPNDIAMIW